MNKNIKVGFELELLAPPQKTRETVANHLASTFNLNIDPCFHRESERWPGSDGKTPYYCLTKGFKLESKNEWKFKIVNDMTIANTIDPKIKESPDWYHILAEDIKVIKLIKSKCQPDSPTNEVLTALTTNTNNKIQIKNGIHVVTDTHNQIICGAHSKMSDRNRICEIITSPLSIQDYKPILESLIEESIALGLTVPKEGAFHIHFDGKIFANSKSLLKFIRYFYCWSDIIKTIIPPNPNCTRLGDFSKAVVNFAFDNKNDHKEFPKLVNELRTLQPVKYCDFNFNNILIGDPDKFTVEIRTIPMILNKEAACAAVDFFYAFICYILSTDEILPKEKFKVNERNMNALLEKI